MDQVKLGLDRQTTHHALCPHTYPGMYLSHLSFASELCKVPENKAPVINPKSRQHTEGPGKGGLPQRRPHSTFQGSGAIIHSSGQSCRLMASMESMAWSRKKSVPSHTAS